ncbi:MAG: hypothetical protein HYV27_04975 [Candidatus Hydrogenedentes bacterium]|nr:hypothetical protein [Candidatus Hydrogenedentota bacterium]
MTHPEEHAVEGPVAAAPGEVQVLHSLRGVMAVVLFLLTMGAGIYIAHWEYYTLAPFEVMEGDTSHYTLRQKSGGSRLQESGYDNDLDGYTDRLAVSASPHTEHRSNWTLWDKNADGWYETVELEFWDEGISGRVFLESDDSAEGVIEAATISLGSGHGNSRPVVYRVVDLNGSPGLEVDVSGEEAGEDSIR